MTETPKTARHTPGQLARNLIDSLHPTVGRAFVTSAVSLPMASAVPDALRDIDALLAQHNALLTLAEDFSEALWDAGNHGFDEEHQRRLVALRNQIAIAIRRSY